MRAGLKCSNGPMISNGFMICSLKECSNYIHTSLLDVFVYGSIGIDWVILKKDIYPQHNGTRYISLLGSTVADWALSLSGIEIVFLEGSLFPQPVKNSKRKTILDPVQPTTCHLQSLSGLVLMLWVALLLKNDILFHAIQWVKHVLIANSETFWEVFALFELVGWCENLKFPPLQEEQNVPTPP